MKMAMFVKAIETRPGSGIWVTAQNGGANNHLVVYNTTLENCPKIGDRIWVTIEKEE